jgi:hypothetical protein
MDKKEIILSLLNKFFDDGGTWKFERDDVVPRGVV